MIQNSILKFWREDVRNRVLQSKAMAEREYKNNPCPEWQAIIDQLQKMADQQPAQPDPVDDGLDYLVG
jgi:hypothetical protein